MNMSMRAWCTFLLASFIGGWNVSAQTSSPVTTSDGTPAAVTAPVLPPAPAVQLSAPVTPGGPQSTSPPVQGLPDTHISVPAVAGDGPTLTLSQAEQIALTKNPRIDISRLLALAQGQAVREQRAAELPTVAGNLTAVYAREGSRITAGALNNPVLYQRAAAGVTLNQLITDFGRTRNLVSAADLRRQAAQSTTLATQKDIVFAVDQAFFRALGAQALITVATQTVVARQATADRVQALANARLRSTLDLSFANADLAQAQLLLLDARNQSASALVTLSALLGDSATTMYRLIDETPATPTAPPAEAPSLVQLAFGSRPDLLSLKQQADAQRHFAAAERDLSRPTINALGAAGGAPVRADQISSSWYGAVGVNINVPIFNGGLYGARAEEAKLRAQAADTQVQQLRIAITRDITTTVLQAQSNFQRIAVARSLADQAASALKLAETRYNLGLSSIVELSQAQLLQTQAQIELTNTRYTYQGSVAAIRYQTGQ